MMVEESFIFVNFLRDRSSNVWNYFCGNVERALVILKG